MCIRWSPPSEHHENEWTPLPEQPRPFVASAWLLMHDGWHRDFTTEMSANQRFAAPESGAAY